MASTSTTMTTGEDVAREAMLYLTSGHPDRGDIARDPYPFFDRLRQHDPVHRSSVGPILVSTYAETQELLRDRRWSRGELSDRPDASSTQQVFLRSLAFRDPPDHTRLRGLVSTVFTPRAVERNREVVREVVQDLLAGLRDRETFDFLADFALLVPLRMICRLVGVEPDREDDFVAWGTAVLAALEPLPQTPDEIREREAVAAEGYAYFADLIQQRRQSPGTSDDIVSKMVDENERTGRTLTDEELIGNIMLLHAAGFSTTRNLITNGYHLLLRHTDARRELAEDLSLMPSAIEEMLRCEGPARNSILRVAPEDMELGGVKIEQGEHVYAILSAADRDPAVFDDPHRFDIRRDGPAHVAFGGGIHMCLGASLARLEAGVALEEVLRAGTLELAVDEVEWTDSFLTRSLVSLPVAWA